MSRRVREEYRVLEYTQGFRASVVLKVTRFFFGLDRVYIVWLRTCRSTQYAETVKSHCLSRVVCLLEGESKVEIA